VRCGPGFDTVTADAKDTVAPDCEKVGYDALLATPADGSTLFVTTSSANNGAGAVTVLLERPTKGLPDPASQGVSSRACMTKLPC
jgi:hypothetical protein